MTNTTATLTLANAYHARAYTNDYIFCFILDYKFYAVKLDNMDVATLINIATLDYTSHKKGHKASLRFRPNNDIKRSIVELGNVVFTCSKDSFEEACKANKYNKGENAERIVTENIFGETWVKDSVPFTDGADVSHYQIKFEGATFATESQLLG